MADVTWGVKVSEELKEQIKRIVADEGVDNKEFMEQLITMYKLNTAKKATLIFNSEIEELEGLTKRISNIFINANEKVKSLMDDRDIKFKSELETKVKLSERLQSEVIKIEEEKEGLTYLYNDMVNQKNDLEKEVNEVNQVNQNYKDLIDEYKSKNDSMIGLVNEYKHYKGEIEKLKETNLSYELRENALNNTLGNLQNQIGYLENKLSETIEIHKAELETIKEKDNFDKEKELLRITKEHQEEILKIKSTFSDKIDKLKENHSKAINQYQNKYKDLLEQLEKVKHEEIKKQK